MHLSNDGFVMLNEVRLLIALQCGVGEMDSLHSP